jgi:hypothetical protein
LNINLDEDIRHCFDQLFIHSPVEARQTYMPQRGKTPRLKWS